MKVFGQLERATLEQVDLGGNPDPIVGRVIADTSYGYVRPLFADGGDWYPIALETAKTRTITGTATVQKGENVVYVSASSSNYTVTLPNPSDIPDQRIYIKKTDLTFKKVTLAAAGGALIDGVSSIKLCTRGEWVELLSDGTQYILLASGYYQGKTAWTPTGTWVSNVTYIGFWWRNGNRICMEVRVICTGAPTSTALHILMPTDVTIDDNQILWVSDDGMFNGLGWANDAISTNYPIYPFYYSSDRFALSGGIYPVDEGSPISFANGDSLAVTVLDVPVVDWRG